MLHRGPEFVTTYIWAVTCVDHGDLAPGLSWWVGQVGPSCSHQPGAVPREPDPVHIAAMTCRTTMPSGMASCHGTSGALENPLVAQGCTFSSSGNHSKPSISMLDFPRSWLV